MTTEEHIALLPEDRQEPTRRLAQAVRDHLHPGFAERASARFISFVVPHSVFPAGYHCDPKEPVPFISIGNFKGHLGFYPFCIYTDNGLREWLVSEAANRGVKLDMGKGCIRFKNMEKVPFDLLGELVSQVTADEFLAHYQAGLDRT